MARPKAMVPVLAGFKTKIVKNLLIRWKILIGGITVLTLESLTEECTDEELQLAFEEISKWRETGILKDGVVKRAFVRFEEENVNAMLTELQNLENAFLFEIAKRRYAN